MVRRLVLAYWPLIFVAVTISCLGVILTNSGEGWALRDWIGTVYLSFAITIATIVIARRQSQLQEALADLELTEKCAVIHANSSAMRNRPEPGVLNCVILDSQAGLNLANLARQDMREQFLAAVKMGVETARRTLSTRADPYLTWSMDDWHTFQGALASFHEHLLQVSGQEIRAGNTSPEALASCIEDLRLLAMPNVPLNVFQQIFNTGDSSFIRVRLDWELLHSHALSTNVSLASLDLAEGMDRLHTPWYRDSQGREVGWDHADGTPWAMADLRASVSGLSAEHTSKIHEICRVLRGHTPDAPYEFRIATYDVGSGHRLVLDGNHRLAAALQYPPSVTKVHEFCLTAPISPDIIPDLTHWVAP